jgi:hypothetical protein
MIFLREKSLQHKGFSVSLQRILKNSCFWPGNSQSTARLDADRLCKRALFDL